MLQRSIAVIVLMFGLSTMAVKANEQPIISLNSNPHKLTEFDMSYYVDESRQQSLNQIKRQTFIPSNNKLALGTKAKAAWSKINIQNNSNQPLNLYLHHPYAYHNHKVEFYQLENDNVIKQLKLDLDEADSIQHMYGGAAVFNFDLKPGQVSQLYINTVSYSHQWFTLEIHDELSSKRALVGSQNDIAILVGTLLALMLYNFLLYVSARKKENIFYSLYLISGTVWIALSYGLIANFFGWYGDSVMRLHISLITMPIFLILFMTVIFETRKHYPTEHKLLMALICVLGIEFIYGLFDIKAALEPASSIAAIMMLITLSVCLSILRKGNPIAKLFLVGHMMFIGFNLMAVLYYKGIADFMYITCYGVGIGIALEALMLAFILSYRIKHLEKMEASQNELKKQAATDSMTGLFNRRYFNDHAGNLLLSCREKHIPASIIIADIDHFKQINDNYGHQIGDLVITQFAQILSLSIRKQDMVARFGGEEFVILLTDCSEQQAQKVADNIRKNAELNQIMPDNQPAVCYTVSFGISAVDNKDTSIESALNRADQALYQAKNLGRNKVAIYQNLKRVEPDIKTVGEPV